MSVCLFAAFGFHSANSGAHKISDFTPFPIQELYPLFTLAGSRGICILGTHFKNFVVEIGLIT